MNILVINGSPKGKASNTYRLTSAFVEGLVSRAPGEVREVEAAHVNVAPCRGCFACWNKTPGECVMHDDMAHIIEDLVWADVTIWSFPLYYFGIPAQLKAIIDRQLPMNLPFMAEGAKSGGHPSRYDMSGKRTAVISTCGFYTTEGNYDGVDATFEHLCGKGGFERIYCAQGELFRVKELAARTNAYLDVVRQAGAEYAAGGIAGDTRAELGRLLYSREAFEAMADASWGVSSDGTATSAGEKGDDSLVFTRQMAALYNKASWGGRDRVLEMHYTDLGRRYRVVLGEDGSRVLDDLAAAPAPTTTINTPYTVWRSIAAGEISGTDALAQHLYNVEGDFGLMVNWDQVFGDGGAGAAGASAGLEAASASDARNASWLALLLPWTVFWSGAAMDPFWGSLATLVVCAVIPAVLRRSRRTVYDALSAAAAGVMAAALLAGAPQAVVLTVSYLAFGALWLGSCATPVPLCAHYSMSSYGGQKALENVMFVKTNRILAAAWGVLYLALGACAALLFSQGLGEYAAVASWVAPAIMGVFTAWFQRWYPAHLARG